jgi:hypothetical protein
MILTKAIITQKLFFLDEEENQKPRKDYSDIFIPYSQEF